MKRRKLTVFSLSFIDCICCGLGAIILLFVVVNSQNTALRQRVTEEGHAAQHHVAADHRTDYPDDQRRRQAALHESIREGGQQPFQHQR